MMERLFFMGLSSKEHQFFVRRDSMERSFFSTLSSAKPIRGHFIDAT